MMSDYSREKFLQLSDSRKLQVVYQLALVIEKNWENLPQRKKFLEKLSLYFDWLKTIQSEEMQRVAQLSRLLGGSKELRHFLNVLVPIERVLQKNVKDEQILAVTFKDRQQPKETKVPLIVILENLRSAFNVGSIFRTADTLGVSHIYLVGYTPTPEDFGVKKTAMGSPEFVSWSVAERLDDLITPLKQQGVFIVGLETSPQATFLTEFQAPTNLAIVLGNERFGLTEATLSKLDGIVAIPTRGVKNSLNVSSAFAIAGFEVLRQWGF